jgi:hypothetical protein
MVRCQRTTVSGYARNPEDKVTWRRMAERWLRCAELFTKQSLAARHNTPTKQPRNPALSWAPSLKSQ